MTNVDSGLLCFVFRMFKKANDQVLHVLMYLCKVWAKGAWSTICDCAVVGRGVCKGVDSLTPKLASFSNFLQL